MAKTVELYLSKADEEKLLQTLRPEFQIVFVRVLCYNEDERTFDTLGDLGKYPTDAQVALAMSEFPVGSYIDSFPEGHRRLHTQDSSVIEYNRPRFLAPGRLKPGRLAYFSDGKCGAKAVSFCTWARLVFSRVRKLLNRCEAPIRSLIGSEAESLVKEGKLDLTTW